MDTTKTPTSAEAGRTDHARARGDDARVAVIVACGGKGVRFHQNVDPDKKPIVAKQFALLAGKPVLAHTLDVLEAHPNVCRVVLVLPARYMDAGEALVQGQYAGMDGRGYRKVSAILAGGADRQASVEHGLAALDKAGWLGPVLVHDGVRPCTPSAVYDRVIEGVYALGNAVAAIPLRDTIKRVDAQGVVLETLDRQDIWQIQTPQGFWMAELMDAYALARRRGIRATDDAGLMEALGRQVHLVPGDPANSKLTDPGDLDVLEALLARRQVEAAVVGGQ